MGCGASQPVAAPMPPLQVTNIDHLQETLSGKYMDPDIPLDAVAPATDTTFHVAGHGEEKYMTADQSEPSSLIKAKMDILALIDDDAARGHGHHSDRIPAGKLPIASTHQHDTASNEQPAARATTPSKEEHGVSSAEAATEAKHNLLALLGLGPEADNQNDTKIAAWENAAADFDAAQQVAASEPSRRIFSHPHSTGEGEGESGAAASEPHHSAASKPNLRAMLGLGDSSRQEEKSSAWENAAALHDAEQAAEAKASDEGPERP